LPVRNLLPLAANRPTMTVPATNRRVVITGLGLVSPLGNTPQALWENLQSGTSGVAPLVNLPPLAGRVEFGGECRDFAGEIDDFGELEKDLKKSIRKALKMMCRESMMAVAAAQSAIADGGFGPGAPPMDPDRSGVVFGSDYMLSPPDDLLAGMLKCGVGAGRFDYSKWGGAGLKEMNPLWMLSYLPNMPASHIAIFNDLRGPNNSLTMRESSGLLAIREAVQTIERGHADWMIAGATGTRIHSFKTLHALQTEQLANAELPPAEASRPFDADRTGMVVGEGAGAIVIEELESARARGATIYGEIVGTASSAVLNGRAQGRRESALAAAARAALASSRLSAGDVGHINAHALGTTIGDVEEAAALRAAFGAEHDSIPVVAAKSYFGNLGAGGGVVETIASVLALQRDRLFATLNYVTPDPNCPLRVTTPDEAGASGASFLKLSITPQAQAAALVVARCE
jgi:3-oxoacyl-[acyl-carrier-protein] synthase II